MIDSFIYTVYYLSFGMILLLVIGGALLAVTARNLIYCFFGLVGTLLGVAGLYYNLGSPLLAVMQVMIYIGAVCVAIAFGLSLTRKKGEEGVKPLDIKAAIPVVLVVTMLSATLKSLSGREIVASAHKIDESRIGWMLLKEYLLPFELISILLTVAVIGAITIALINRRI
ncbi:NADH-quinone oxidoreductase subunit J [Desulfolithobacter dissulfuricans]|uniref:NADH-quinone oxidoreductase subunit J n=1 Tax=Desulfolithobacter dissulfuricans TaxID=2795293 RepID=A0A915U3Q5_9BACT|nr:NADH-quinone oxidoreductase subunit J [Desulfolithobacter dissulfuricans]BCO10743.1 NADH-quinone oxidoreductase subunit J [Desulfolithobacter dissulfuricans]